MSFPVFGTGTVKRPMSMPAFALAGAWLAVAIPHPAAAEEMASASTSPAEGARVYGPPAPKAEKGKVPDIGWTEAPVGVPPALDQAVHIVTRNYPSANSARAALGAAASDVSAAKWLRFPSLSANLEYLDDSRSPEPQLSVEVPVWSGGRIGAQIKRAKASEDVSSASYVETVQSLALTT